MSKRCPKCLGESEHYVWCAESTADQIKFDSKIDEILAWAPHAEDGASSAFYAREDIEQARTELAALRRRAEDLELLFRAYRGVPGAPVYMAVNMPNMFEITSIRYIGHLEHEPLLTDEAREALK